MVVLDVVDSISILRSDRLGNQGCHNVSVAPLVRLSRQYFMRPAMSVPTPSLLLCALVRIVAPHADKLGPAQMLTGILWICMWSPQIHIRFRASYTSRAISLTAPNATANHDRPAAPASSHRSAAK